ncbi:hypothetical protein ACWGI8_07585 [Streptomyces sp. NPDC054841]
MTGRTTTGDDGDGDEDRGQDRNGAGAGAGDTEQPAAGAARTDFAGAVYGSLLAASVVAGAGAYGPFPRFQLGVLILVTGLVYWATHVYVRLVGDRLLDQPLNRREFRRVCAREWPILQAAVPPAAAVALGGVLGLDLEGTAWLALAVAVGEQVGWATAAVVRAGASWRLVVASGAINLLLGLIIVVVKAAIQH